MSWLRAFLQFRRAADACYSPGNQDKPGSTASALGDVASSVGAKRLDAAAPANPIDEQYLVQNAQAMRYVKLSSGALAFYSKWALLPHAEGAFEELHRALQSATDEIFLATWFLEPGMELLRHDWDKPIAARAPSVLENVLLGRAKAGVVVRILVWNFVNLAGGLLPDLRRSQQLGAALKKISPSNDVVIVEHPLPFATHTVLGVSFPLGGAHHQKYWITRSGGRLTAFVGGMNFRQHDWDTAGHAVLDQRRNPADMEGAERKRKQAAQEEPAYPPRHDWMARLEGPAAYRVLQEFDRRWGMAGKGRLSPPAFKDIAPAGGEFAQVSHTYPIDFGGGSFEILEVYEHAISQARRYLYFENQYWTSERLTDAVAAQLQKEKDLEVVMVLPDKAEDPVIGAYIAGEQWYQLSRLWAAGSAARVRAYVLSRKHPAKAGYVNVYVHAKLAIADDLWLTVGSANTNNRSMSVDTECNVQIANGTTVKAVRKDLWREMVGALGEQDDAIAAIRSGFHAIGEQNEKRMTTGAELEGLIVPLKEPKELKRLPESLRLLL